MSLVNLHCLNKSVIIILFILTVYFLILPAHALEQQSVTRLENGIWSAKLGKQIQITTDLTNGQDRPQLFAYIVQIENQEGTIVSLSWITGKLDTEQSLNPAQSWIPNSPGLYTARIFVWAGIDNPDALSPPLSIMIDVT